MILTVHIAVIHLTNLVKLANKETSHHNTYYSLEWRKGLVSSAVNSESMEFRILFF